MDLSTIKPIEKRYDLQDPATGKPTGMIVTLACAHDERIKAAFREVNDEILKGGKELSPSDEKRLDDKMAAAYITDVEFTGDASWKGEKPEYSKALAMEICAIPVLKEQVLFEARRTRDFYKA